MHGTGIDGLVHKISTRKEIKELADMQFRSTSRDIISLNNLGLLADTNTLPAAWTADHEPVAFEAFVPYSLLDQFSCATSFKKHADKGIIRHNGFPIYHFNPLVLLRVCVDREFNTHRIAKDLFEYFLAIVEHFKQEEMTGRYKVIVASINAATLDNMYSKELGFEYSGKYVTGTGQKRLVFVHDLRN